MSRPGRVMPSPRDPWDAAVVDGDIGGARWQRVDRWLAGFAGVLVGLGAVVSLAGVGAGDLRLALVGGAAFAVGLGLLIASGWLDGVWLLLISLPLPALYSAAEARLTPVLVVAAVVTVGYLVKGATLDRIGGVGRAPTRPVLFLLAAAALATAFAQAPLPAVRELANLSLLLTLLLVLTRELGARRDRLETLPIWIAALGGVGGVVALGQALGIAPTQFPLQDTSLFRATLGLGWPNEAAMLFALSLPFTVHVIRTSSGAPARLLGLMAFIGCLTGLIATFSRGSWLAVLVAPSIPLLLGRKRAALGFWLLAVVGVVAFDAVGGGIVRDRVLNLLTDQVVEQRGALMLAGVLMFLAHPVVGVGPGGFGPSLEQYGPQIAWLWDYVGSPHNAYVHAAAEMGAVGFVAFVTFLVVTFRILLAGARAAREADGGWGLADTVLWSFTTACLVSFVEWPLAHGIGELIVIVAAMGYALAPCRPTGRVEP